MSLNHTFPHFFASIDASSLGKGAFDCSRNDIEKIVRFFSLGKLEDYKIEKNVKFSHFNSIVFAATSQGQYALKFYTPDYTNTTRSISLEYALNRILTHHHFLTPLMHQGINGAPFLKINGRFVACYSYIDGKQVVKSIKQRAIFTQINAVLFSLKNILSKTNERLNFPKGKTLLTIINTLTQDSKSIAPYEQKELIDTILLDCLRAYKYHRVLFTRQLIHSNTHIDNFLIYKKNIFTLDLSHVQEDYILTDLLGIVTSCLFLNTPAATIKGIIKDYFTKHCLEGQQLSVFDTLIKVQLTREYLKLFTYPADVLHAYIPHLPERKKSIIIALKKINDILRSML